MLSLTDTILFSFCKRSFVLGTILLSSIILFTFGMGQAVYYMIQQNITPSPETFKKVGVALYILQNLGYSILFAYLFIRAKQTIYELPAKFSSEFFIRVFLTIFCLSIITSVGFYLSAPYIQKHLLNAIMFLSMSPSFPWKEFILKMLLPFLGYSFLIGYILSAIYMAYVMHFNFQRFAYKCLRVLQNPLIFLQIVAFTLLFFLFILLPVIGLYFVLRTFSTHDFVMSFASCIMGQSSATSLIVYTIVFGGPIAITCFATKTGRLVALLFTLLYALIYGLIWIVFKQINFPLNFSMPMSAVLYLYMFFFIFCLMFVMTSIIWPSGIVHLIVQGAFQVHKKFEPSVDKQIPLKTESSVKDDGWL